MAQRPGSPRFRIWITRYEDWQPSDLRQRPPDAVAVEPAEPETMTDRQAQRYVEAFNRLALAGGRKLWAVAVPVVSKREGEPTPGHRLP